MTYKEVIERIGRDYPNGVKNPKLTKEEYDIVFMNAVQGLLNMGVTDSPKLITIFSYGGKISIETIKYKDL